MEVMVDCATEAESEEGKPVPRTEVMEPQGRLEGGKVGDSVAEADRIEHQQTKSINPKE